MRASGFKGQASTQLIRGGGVLVHHQLPAQFLTQFFSGTRRNWAAREGSSHHQLPAMFLRPQMARLAPRQMYVYFYTCLTATLLTASLAEPPLAQSLGQGDLQDMPLRQMPVVQNFWSSATLRRESAKGSGLIGLGPLAFTPYNGNFQNSSFSLDNRTFPLATNSWAVCEGTRVAGPTEDGFYVANVVQRGGGLHAVHTGNPIYIRRGKKRQKEAS